MGVPNQVVISVCSGGWTVSVFDTDGKQYDRRCRRRGDDVASDSVGWDFDNEEIQDSIDDIEQSCMSLSATIESELVDQSIDDDERLNPSLVVCEFSQYDLETISRITELSRRVTNANPIVFRLPIYAIDDKPCSIVGRIDDWYDAAMVMVMVIGENFPREVELSKLKIIRKSR